MERQIAELAEAVAENGKVLERIAVALEQAADRKKYQSEYYKKRKATVAQKQKKIREGRLKMRDRHCLKSRDVRLPIEEWARKLKEFSDRGLSAYNFIQWLAWTWNQNTYDHVPITKSGGYMHVFIGLSEKRALRAKYSERDVTGHMRMCRFSKREHLDTFSEALWWKWSYGTLWQVIYHIQKEKWYETLGDSWDRPLRVSAGCYGCYEIRGITFDPNERSLETMTKVYGYLRPTLSSCWGSFLRGLFCKVEPFRAAT